MTDEIEYIYGLETCGSFIYVGRTNSIERRFKEHLNSASQSGTLKEKIIFELLEAGEDIGIKILKAGTAKELEGQEDLFICNLTGSGHPITNAVAGTSALVEYVPSDKPVQPWSIELFQNADWTKTEACKTGEVTCDIKGFTFYRTGNRKLRFWHVSYGNWKIEGSNLKDYSADGDMKQKYLNACEQFTHGTERHEKFLKVVASVRQSRG